MQKNHKTFLVTGCNGYIGSHMCYELREKYPNCIIIGIDKVNKEHLRHLYNEFEHYDLRKGFPDIFGFQIDCIFHFAALANVPEGETFKHCYYRNNILSSLNTLYVAEQYNIKNLVFSSSCAVYGKPSIIPIPETHSKNPIGVYARSKSFIEDVLLDIEKEGWLQVAILRYFNVAGRNVKANLFEEHDPETHLIPLLVKNDNISVYGNDYDTPDGSCVRDYIHVIDVCRAHVLAYEYMEKNKKGIVCNIGTNHGITVLEMIKLVEKVCDKKINIEIESRRRGDVPYLVSDPTRMKKELTFEPEYSMVDMIKSLKEKECVG